MVYYYTTVLHDLHGNCSIILLACKSISLAEGSPGMCGGAGSHFDKQTANMHKKGSGFNANKLGV